MSHINQTIGFPTIKDQKGTIIVNPQQKADAFANHFANYITLPVTGLFECEPYCNFMNQEGDPCLLENHQNENPDGETNAYVLSVDVGTTSLRCHIYDRHGNIRGSSSKRIEMQYPHQGWVEVVPDVLFDQLVLSVKESLQAASLKSQQLTCMGLACMRNTFVTWDSETGKPFHNFISWQDLRATEHTKLWNTSYAMKLLHNGSKFLHFFTRKKRFIGASVLKFSTNHVSMRLLWCLDTIPELRQRASEGKAMFGCVETWLLWRLTGKKVHATDCSCASATGLFDPFVVEWSSVVCNMLNIPMNILPQCMDTSGHFGDIDPELFGTSIPITAIVADQQSALFGECCFKKGDLKLTMGTGTFIDLNTGDSPQASYAGLYPLVGWKIKEETVFIAEGCATDTGIVLEWAKSYIGFFPGYFEDVTETSNMAESVPNSGGVYFVPAFTGLQAPINDERAVTTMIGMTPATTKSHIVRALLESFAFRFKLLYETLLTETKIPLSHICADGGVCNNNFLMQLMSDLTSQTIDRAKQRADITSLGAAFLAGLGAGVWKSKEELIKIRSSDRIFQPKDTWSKYKNTFYQWERAVGRSMRWYKETDVQ
ncbi:hypothetical protein ScPMuIL_018806 [Solemya velum]